MAQQITSVGSESLGVFYNDFKKSVTVTINGTNKIMSTPSDIAYYILQNFYDNNGQGPGQRLDLFNAIEMGCGLYKGNI